MSIHGYRDRRIPILLGLVLLIAPLVTPGPATAEIPAPAAAAADSPVGEQLDWLLGQLNSEVENFGPIRVSEHFAPEYLDALPTTDLIAIVRDLAESLAPVALARFEGLSQADAAVAIITTDTIDDWRITIGVEPNAPHRITALFLTPVPYPSELANPPERWSDLDTDLKNLASRASFLAAEIVDGQCDTIHGLNEDAPLAIGSSFKLYVLGELADQIARDARFFRSVSRSDQRSGGLASSDG